MPFVHFSIASVSALPKYPFLLPREALATLLNFFSTSASTLKDGRDRIESAGESSAH